MVEEAYAEIGVHGVLVEEANEGEDEGDLEEEEAGKGGNGEGGCLSSDEEEEEEEEDDTCEHTPECRVSVWSALSSTSL